MYTMHPLSSIKEDEYGNFSTGGGSRLFSWPHHFENDSELPLGWGFNECGTVQIFDVCGFVECIHYFS